jgi:SAM-dependent methyltransferase
MGIRRRIIDFTPAVAVYNACTYVLFQGRLSFETLRERRGSTGAVQEEPAPPVKLRWRVHGTLDRASYLAVGKLIAQNIQDLCETAGRDFSSFNDILDFGCGCGRVVQNLRGQPGSYALYATDIDPDLVDWGRSNLQDIQWSVNGHRPPLPFNDDAFDLIYGISVFTHLDEDFQDVWLRELRRVARPGATVILTVHGEHVISGLRMLDPSYIDEIHDRGFMFFKWSKGKLKIDGFPDFYQTAFHTKEYIYNQWSKYFEIVDYVERGIGNYQDAVVLRKPLN